MKLSVKDIQRFFEAKFEKMDPGPGLALHHFDGYVHWEVWCIEDLLCVMAVNDMEHSAFPIVEFSIYCSHLSTSIANGVGPVLMLHSNDNSDEISRVVVLTKTKEGRISLSACLGSGRLITSGQR
jgi:hypothetical protein